MNSINNKISFGVICSLLITLMLTGCQKLDNEFQKYLDGKEIVYPGTPSEIKVYSGDGRVKFDWIASPDPSIVKYLIYWNNGLDSAFFDVPKGEAGLSGSILVNHLQEGTHFFTLYTIDRNNNKSIPISISNVKVFGDFYRAGLINRTVLSTNVSDNNEITVFFSEGTLSNKETVVEYTDTNGNMKKLSVSQGEREILISNWKIGTPVWYQSSYEPTENALDTFFTLNKERMQIRKDISGTYLVNYNQPFIAIQSDGRFRDPLNWIVTEPVKNHSAKGGWGTDEGTVLVMESGWGAGDIINGKLYQVTHLPAGTYSIQLELASFGINSSQVKLVAAPGSSLPDISSDGKVINAYAIADLDIKNLTFTVPSAGPVSIGFAVNMRGNQFWRVKKVSLFGHY